VVYLAKKVTVGVTASDSRDDFRVGGGRTSLLLPPGAENPSYATGALRKIVEDIPKNSATEM